MITSEEIIKLLRAIHLALHAEEEKNRGTIEKSNLSDNVSIKLIKNGHKK